MQLETGHNISISLLTLHETDITLYDTDIARSHC